MIQAIAASTELLEEARACLPALRSAAFDPASRPAIRRIIGARFATYPQPHREEPEWAAWWQDYFDALADLPAPAIEAGMKAWLALPDSEFMPKPGRLRELAKTTPHNGGQAWFVARSAVEMAQERQEKFATGPGGPPPREISPGEREQVKRMFSELAETMRGKLPEKPPVRPTQAKVDATGVSPELRALVERQRAPRPQVAE